MAGTEPTLPKPVASNLLLARDIIVDCVDEWLRLWRARDTIGHAGRVTQKFIIEQAGMGTRALVTVVSGTAERLAGGKAVQALPLWTIFFVTRGRIRDRTDDGLNVVGEAQRFILSDPFGQVDKTLFCKPPQVDTLTWRNLYTDADENTGYSIWAVAWRSEIALGTAGRERPGRGRLLEVIGTDVYLGVPNGDAVDFSLLGVETSVDATTAALGSAEAYIATETQITLTISNSDILRGRDPLQFLVVAKDAGGVETVSISDGGEYTVVLADGTQVPASDGDYGATQLTSNGGGRGAEFTVTLTGGAVTAVTVDAPGARYLDGERVTLLLVSTGPQTVYTTLAATLVVDSRRTVTIATEGAQTIDGEATATLERPNQRLVLGVTDDGNLERVS
jgi:hypothetical protein